MTMTDTANINKWDVVILCGGQGTRLRNTVINRPKSMALIKEKPFLDIVMDLFYRQGFRRFILCTGFMGQFIRDYYTNSNYAKYIFYSEEEIPLGTAGAVKKAEKFIKSENFFVVNGDSYCRIDLQKFTTFHLSLSGRLVSIALVKKDNRDDGGGVSLNGNFLISSFSEKNLSVPHPYINTGTYIFNKKILSLIPSGQPSSLEYDLFPEMVGKNIFGFVVEDRVYDIGTPERYKNFLKVYKSY